jgi:hypothetical protein
LAYRCIIRQSGGKNLLKKKKKDAPKTKIKNNLNFLKFDNKRRFFFLKMNKKDHFKTNKKQ